MRKGTQAMADAADRIMQGLREALAHARGQAAEGKTAPHAEAVAVAALSDDDMAAIQAAEVPAEHAALDAELDG